MHFAAALNLTHPVRTEYWNHLFNKYRLFKWAEAQASSKILTVCAARPHKYSCTCLHPHTPCFSYSVSTHSVLWAPQDRSPSRGSSTTWSTVNRQPDSELTLCTLKGSQAILVPPTRQEPQRVIGDSAAFPWLHQITQCCDHSEFSPVKAYADARVNTQI